MHQNSENSEFNLKQTSIKITILAAAIFSWIRYLKRKNKPIPPFLVLLGRLAGSCLSQSKLRLGRKRPTLLGSKKRR